jgi:hypothetical protein
MPEVSPSSMSVDDRAAGVYGMRQSSMGLRVLSARAKADAAAAAAASARYILPVRDV